MNIYEEELYPWLSKEKQFIKEAINAGKIVFGVCLGAQLIADALGAKIYKTQQPPAKAGGLVLRTKVRIRVIRPV